MATSHAAFHSTEEALEAEGVAGVAEAEAEAATEAKEEEEAEEEAEAAAEAATEAASHPQRKLASASAAKLLTYRSVSAPRATARTGTAAFARRPRSSARHAS